MCFREKILRLSHGTSWWGRHRRGRALTRPPSVHELSKVFLKEHYSFQVPCNFRPYFEEPPSCHLTWHVFKRNFVCARSSIDIWDGFQSHTTYMQYRLESWWGKEKLLWILYSSLHMSTFISPYRNRFCQNYPSLPRWAPSSPVQADGAIDSNRVAHDCSLTKKNIQDSYELDRKWSKWRSWKN